MRSYPARCRLTALAFAAAVLVVPVVAQGQEADEGGENVLLLSRALCGEKYYDRPRMAECLARQNAKADRWMSAIVESHARMGAKEMADLVQMGGHPFDVVTQLRKSQAAFEVYRKEESEYVGQASFGMTVVLFSAASYFDLTVDRARHLLNNCNAPLSAKLIDNVDLTITDWCSSNH